MTRARYGAASAATDRAVTWRSLPQPDDDEPGPGYRPFVLIDGDEHMVRTTVGAKCLAVYDRRRGWRVSEDDPTYGTDDEPSGSSDHSIDVAAVAVERAVPSRSGKHTSPRMPPVSVEPELLAQIDAECEESAISRTDWLREAIRAYLILRKKDKLTDADWRRVVSG